MGRIRNSAITALAVAALAVPSAATATTTGGVTAPTSSGATSVGGTTSGGATSGSTSVPGATGGTRAGSTAPKRPRRPARHRRRKRPRKPPPVRQPAPAPPAASAHVFPLVGAFTYGDGFGVDRPGHIHQGQDLLAPAGTPIVAPHGGMITKVDYQAGGAGNYVVLKGSGENLQYVFMHMVTGSVRVAEGQKVRMGQRIGDVGTTGASSGTHLHFEIWQGEWQLGGTAIDPLPYLKRWRAG